jgi:hypothetical protein
MFFSRTYVARRLEDVRIIISDGVIGCHWEIPAQRILKDLGWEHEECDGLVYLWLMTRRGLPPLVLRLIVLQRGNRKIHLPTNVFDPRQLSDEEAGMLYEMRWGIEVFYRSYKQTLSRRSLLSRTPATCLAESQWTMPGLWLPGLLTVERLTARRVDPLYWSVAMARNAVRRAMRAPLRRTRRGRLHELAAATKDSYERHGKKTPATTREKKEKTRRGRPKSNRPQRRNAYVQNNLKKNSHSPPERRCMAPDKI